MQFTIRRILATLLLLVIAQGVQAEICSTPPAPLSAPPSFDLGTIGPGSYFVDCAVPDANLPNIGYVEFMLGDISAVELSTSSNQVDTVLGLFLLDEPSSTYLLQGQADEGCPPPAFGPSCLSFSGLPAGSYLAMVSDWFMFTSGSEFFVDFLSSDPLVPSDLFAALTENDGQGGGDFRLDITVSAVPVPAAVWLFGSALLGFVGMSRRTSIKS